MLKKNCFGIWGLLVYLALAFVPGLALAHCDTMDGPVVTTARKALEKGDITPVLKWVKPEYENEIRSAFKKTLSVRSKGEDARALADMYFYETLVRVHRAGEGEPYTGIKPAGVQEPIVVQADKALEEGNPDHLVHILTSQVVSGVRARFTEAWEKKKHAEENVPEGREFVEAYVKFMHYIERLHSDAKALPAHDGMDHGH